MSNRKAKATMTDLLRAALADADSLLGVQKATGVKRQSMALFMRGKQSLRLDMADRLAEYFGIECRRVERKER
jgi:plasmid maintenance system antidote protein VapI